jgi:hypothetical protein
VGACVAFFRLGQVGAQNVKLNHGLGGMRVWVRVVVWMIV